MKRRLLLIADPPTMLKGELDEERSMSAHHHRTIILSVAFALFVAGIGSAQAAGSWHSVGDRTPNSIYKADITIILRPERQLHRPHYSYSRQHGYSSPAHRSRRPALGSIVTPKGALRHKYKSHRRYVRPHRKIIIKRRY
ncbi:MAG: hypothetical protein AAGG57_07790 [Pseudomonadota bacterium]